MQHQNLGTTYWTGSRVWHVLTPPAPNKPVISIVAPPNAPEFREDGWPPKPELRSVA